MCDKNGSSYLIEMKKWVKLSSACAVAHSAYKRRSFKADTKSSLLGQLSRLEAQIIFDLNVCALITQEIGQCGVENRLKSNAVVSVWGGGLPHRHLVLRAHA